MPPLIWLPSRNQYAPSRTGGPSRPLSPPSRFRIANRNSGGGAVFCRADFRGLRRFSTRTHGELRGRKRQAAAAGRQSNGRATRPYRGIISNRLADRRSLCLCPFWRWDRLGWRRGRRGSGGGPRGWGGGGLRWGRRRRRWWPIDAAQDFVAVTAAGEDAQSNFRRRLGRMTRPRAFKWMAASTR